MAMGMGLEMPGMFISFLSSLLITIYRSTYNAGATITISESLPLPPRSRQLTSMGRTAHEKGPGRLRNNDNDNNGNGEEENNENEDRKGPK